MVKTDYLRGRPKVFFNLCGKFLFRYPSVLPLHGRNSPDVTEFKAKHNPFLCCQQLLLSIAAVVALALGIYQSVGRAPETYESPECPNNLCEIKSLEWVEGVAIIVAILIVVMVGALNDYQKELQFRKLNATKEDRKVEVIRDGKEKEISVYDVVVGDICLLKPGEIIPVDGVFLSGYNVQCDESSATGESDLIKKGSFEECKTATADGKKKDPFLLSGSKVDDGSGKYICIGVGQRSFLGRIMMRMYLFSNNLRGPSGFFERYRR
jgi:Ca2+-transporting ATPase